MSLQLTRGGYGKSTKPNGLTVTSETSADDLKSVIDFIKNLRHLEKVDIVGHSFGGMVAVCLAAKYPEYIGRIVSISAPYKVIHPGWKPFLDRMLEMAHKGAPYVPNEHHLTLEQKVYSYEQEIVDTYKALIDEAYQEWPTGVFLDLESLKYSEYIPSVSAPTLLINGALEYVVDPDDAVQCLNDLGAKQKALLVVGNAYHLVFLEEIAHRIVNQAVLAWLCS
jgi:pimeloyl-ACP methyl ester carboxylesterase